MNDEDILNINVSLRKRNRYRREYAHLLLK